MDHPTISLKSDLSRPQLYRINLLILSQLPRGFVTTPQKEEDYIKTMRERKVSKTFSLSIIIILNIIIIVGNWIY